MLNYLFGFSKGKRMTRLRKLYIPLSCMKNWNFCLLISLVLFLSPCVCMINLHLSFVELYHTEDYKSLPNDTCFRKHGKGSALKNWHILTISSACFCQTNVFYICSIIFSTIRNCFTVNTCFREIQNKSSPNISVCLTE